MPQNGDIVIRRQRCDGEQRFILRPLSGPDQFTLATRGAAVAAAIEVALREQVCVWWMHDDGAFTLLNDCRASGVKANASVVSTDADGGRKTSGSRNL